MSDKKLWRPTLFSALGAGFKNDDTVHDGIHLRWSFDPKLGLPFEIGEKNKGNFKVFVMNQGVKSIQNVDLFKADRKTYRINSSNLFNLQTNANASLLPLNNKLYFIKSTHQNQVALDWHYKNMSKYIRTLSFLHTKEDKKFFNYMDDVMEGYRPFYVPTKSEWEIAEVCAIDIDFFSNPIENTNLVSHKRKTSRRKFTMHQFHRMNIKTATKLAGDITKFSKISNHSIIKNAVQNFKVNDIKKTAHTIKKKPIQSVKSVNMGHINAIKKPIQMTAMNPRIIKNIKPTTTNLVFSHFKNDIYIRVKAWDRNDQLIDEDWIGKPGQTPFIIKRGFNTKSKKTSNRLKTRVKLRAPGIEYITFEFIPNKPILYPKFFNYVFCEDYCRSEKIWSSSRTFETRFNGTSHFHIPINVRDKHYAPFKRGFDWGELSFNMRRHFIEDPDVQELLKQKNSYDTYKYHMHYDAPDATNEAKDSINIPLLPSLMSASVDPSFANILGLYKYINQLTHDGRDFKVEADFPFFELKNIEEMDHKLAKLIINNPNNSILQQLKFIIANTKLCGLILAPRISKKPAPPTPTPLKSKVKTIDLPNQQNPKVYDLFGDANIEIPFKENEIRPYQRTITVALDRSHNGGPFENIIESEQTSFNPLEAFSILPGVYLAKKENGILKNPMEIDDYFSLPAIDDNDVQYQGRGYDIFGRPSLPAQGPKHKLPLPCKPPQKPANLSSQVVYRGDDLFLEVHFSVYEGILPLVAQKKTIELCIHDLPKDQNAPENVTWVGSKVAKTFSINYNLSGTILNINAITETCNQLQWVGNKLNRSSTNTNHCNTAFSNATPSIKEQIVPSFSLADTGFRSYKLSWKIASKSTLSPNVYQWACRIRVKGVCEKSGAILYSSEPVISASTRITPPPPPVQQPILTKIPESTFADHKGDSYFPVDLNDFIPVGDRSTRPMVRIYTTTIDTLFDDLKTIVQENMLLDQALFLTQAKKTKLPYKLITTDPIRYSPSNRFVEVKVPGDLEEYHVVGVIGCNEYLEEVSWKNSGILLFKTPTPIQIPQLQCTLSDPFIGLGGPKVALEFSAKFISNPPSPAHPPRIQLFRKNNTLADKRNVFLNTIEGELDNTSTNEVRYVFQYFDDDILSLNRYEYEASLLLFSEKQGHYIKSNEPSKCSIIAPLETGIDPSTKIEPPQTIINPDNTTITFEFDAGEYEFSLTKKAVDGTKQRHTGKIRNGVLYFKAFTAKLTVDAQYTLVFEDPDINSGVYTLRLSYGQIFTWTKKTELTS